MWKKWHVQKKEHEEKGLKGGQVAGTEKARSSIIKAGLPDCVRYFGLYPDDKGKLYCLQ